MRQREEQEHSKRAVEAAAAVTGPSPGVMGSPAGSRAAQEALDRATASARCTDTSGLESAMKLARKKGVNTRAAEARLHELQDEKRRKDRVRASLEEALLNARLGVCDNTPLNTTLNTTLNTPRNTPYQYTLSTAPMNTHSLPAPPLHTPLFTSPPLLTSPPFMPPLSLHAPPSPSPLVGTSSTPPPPLPPPPPRPLGDRAGLEEAMGCAVREGLDVTEARMYLASMHEEKRGKDDVAMRLQSAMERARVDNTLELETLIEVARREGVNVVSAGLVLLDLEHEKRRIEGVVATLQVQHTPSRHLVNTPHHHFF